MATEQRDRSGRSVALRFLVEHGPSTTPAMSERTGLPSAHLRKALRGLESAGEVVRAGTRPATDALGREIGGPRAVLWAIPQDAGEDVLAP